MKNPSTNCLKKWNSKSRQSISRTSVSYLP